MVRAEVGWGLWTPGGAGGSHRKRNQDLLPHRTSPLAEPGPAEPALYALGSATRELLQHGEGSMTGQALKVAGLVQLRAPALPVLPMPHPLQLHPASCSCSDATKHPPPSWLFAIGMACQGQHPQKLSRCPKGHLLRENAAAQDIPSLHPSFKTPVPPCQ